MDVCRRITTLVKYFLAIALTLLLAQTSFAQVAENQQMVIEGSLTDVGGNAIDLSGKTLVFYVKTDTCYLYGETTTTAGDSQGNILHRIGSSALVSGSPNSFSQNLFFGSVSGTTVFAGNDCSATASDVRLVQVYYAEQSITATMKLGSVPYAQNATMLGGKGASAFVQTSTDSNTLFYGGFSGQVLTKSASGALSWQTPSITAAQVTSALGYTPVSTTTAVTSSSIATTLGYTPANSATVASLSSSVTTSVTALTGQVNAVSSTVTSLKNSIDASFSTIVSSQWTTSASNIHYTNGNVGIGTMVPATKLDVAGAVRIGMDSAICSPSHAGALRYNSGNLEMCNGSAWNSLGMVGSSITNFNGSTNSTQSFANGTMGLAPAFSTSAGVHTLNIPLAAAASGVTAGLISNVDYTNFNNKITSSPASVVEALGYVPANSTTLGNYMLRGNNLSDLTSSSTARSNLGLGGFATISALDLGSTSATGILADARLANQSSVVSGTQYTKVSVDGKGRVTSGGQLTSGDVTTILGYAPASATALSNYALRSNNLSDLTSATAARLNLELGSLSTKSFITLGTDVSGTLPVANGGSQWQNAGVGISYPGNIGVGSAAVPTNARFYLEATPAVSIAAIIKNTDVNGHGLKIDMAGTSGNQLGLQVKAGGSTVFMAQNDGLIGIGTPSPSTVLNIVNDNGLSHKDDIQIDTYGNSTAALALRKAKGSAAAPTQLPANENIGNLRWDGHTGTSFTNLIALSGYAETDLSTSVNSFLTIQTNSNGAMAERVRVTSNGNVGIGTGASTTAKLHVAGAVVGKPVLVGGTGVDLSQGNMFILNSVGGSAGSAISISLGNMIDGGTYTLVITDLTSHTYSFGGCSNSYFAPANSATIAGTRTIFGLITLKNGSNWDCYINWTPGYQ